MEIDLSLVKTSCQCQKYDTCAWSTQVVNQMAVIPKNMPLWKSLFQSFVVQICDRKERHVWCCRGGEQARGSELEILNRKKAYEDELVRSSKHRSLVGYLPHVKKAKNYPTHSECVLS